MEDPTPDGSHGVEASYRFQQGRWQVPGLAGGTTHVTYQGPCQTPLLRGAVTELQFASGEMTGCQGQSPGKQVQTNSGSWVRRGQLELESCSVTYDT